MLRIAHISDLHLSVKPDKTLRQLEIPGYHSKAALALAQWAYLKREQIDAIVISGDLATTGTNEDLSKAYQFIFASPSHRWLADNDKPTLAGAGADVILMPGNHDRYSGNTLDAFIPGALEFDDVFRKHWWNAFGVQVAEIKPDGLPGIHFFIISADFALRHATEAVGRPKGVLGQGRAHPDVMKALVNKTHRVIDNCKVSKKKALVIWVTHFPPFTHAYPELRTIDADSIIAAANDCGVQLILAGHTHAREVREIGAIRVFVAGSAMGMNRWNADYRYWAHLLKFDFVPPDTVTVCKEDFVYYERENAFREAVLEPPVRQTFTLDLTVG